MSEESVANLHIKFSGEELPTGTIDLYDLANTILALGQTIEAIAKEADIQNRQNIHIEVNALRPGSFEVDLLIRIAGAVISTGQLFNVAGLNQAKAIVEYLAQIIEVKKFLKGEKPQGITINQSGSNSSVTIINVTGDKTLTSVPVYNALQNKAINEGVKKIFQPLTKDGSRVDAIEISSDHQHETETGVIKEEIAYFENTEELQTTNNFKVKGVISAYDRKTNTGRVTLQDNKRPTFEIIPHEDLEEYDQMIFTIIESLKLKIPIYLVGEATLDYASNLKKMKVSNVESEAKLL